MQAFISKRPILWLAGALLTIVVAACGTASVDTTHTLTVSTTGTGSVTSSPEGINTAVGDTSHEFEAGVMVTLTATFDDTTHDFAWGGACEAATGVTCDVEMTGDLNVSATFTEISASMWDYDAAINSGDDDAEEFVTASTDNATAFPSGHTYTHSSDLEFVYDPAHGTLQLVGLRFENVTIPAGATIDAAQILFTADGASTGEVTVTIQGQDDANPDPFFDDPNGSASADISGRLTTTASVDWLVTESWAGGEQRATADISAVVQEIVDLGAWVDGNAMAFILTGSDAADFRRAFSYDGATTVGNLDFVARLQVNYTAP